MTLVLANNAVSALATNISASATQFTIKSGDEVRFPTISPGEWFPLTLVDAAGNTEIVRCTARAGVTMTVERAQEGTSARIFNADTRVELRLTAGTIEHIRDLTAAFLTKEDPIIERGPLLFDSADADDDDGSRGSISYAGDIRRLRAAALDGLGNEADVELYVRGNLEITGDIGGLSDRRRKTNLRPIDDPLAMIEALTGWIYDRTDMKLTQAGLMAQDVEKVLPWAVREDASGALTLAYNQLSAVYVEAIKALAARNKALEDRVATLERFLVT